MVETMNILFPLLAAFGIMAASLAGVIFTHRKFGQWLTKNLSVLVSLAAGTFAFLVYNLSREAVEILGSSTALLIIFGSFIISWVGFKLIPFFHHHHEGSDHEHSAIEGRKILVADGIHNIGDGIILVAAFSVSPTLGIITSLGIFLHEFVQEISEYFVLRRAGYSNKLALMRNFQVSSTILIGVGLAIVLSQLNIEPYLLAVTAGLFLTIVLQDLLPDTIEAAREPGKLLPYAAAFMIGVVMMTGLSIIAGHTDLHDEDHVEL